MAQTLSTKDVEKIPAAYLDMGVQRKFNPTSAQKLRLWITGMPGHGKTNFAMSNNKAIAVDFDDTAGDVVIANDKRAAHLSCSSIPMFHKLVAQLGIDSGPKAPFKHVIIDTLDKYRDMLIEHMTTVYNETHTKKVPSILSSGYEGAGWDAVNKELMRPLDEIYRAGYGWTILGHSKIEKETLPSGLIVHHTIAAINPGIKVAVYREAQVMGYLNMTTHKETKIQGVKLLRGKEVPNKVEQTVAEVTLDITGGGQRAEVKSRYIEYMPSVIRLPAGEGWAAFEKAYVTAVEAAQSQIEKENHNASSK